MSFPEGVGAVIKLSGFALAHAAWSVSDGELLCTLAVVETEAGRRLLRFEADSISESLSVARDELSQIESERLCWAIVFDSYLTVAQGTRQDALVIQPGGVPGLPSRIIQRYQQKSFFHRFKILGQPMFVAESGDLEDASAYEHWFGEGIKEHPKVCELWAKWNS